MRKIRNRFFQLNVGRNKLGEACFLLWLKPKSKLVAKEGVVQSEVWEVGLDGQVSAARNIPRETTR